MHLGSSALCSTNCDISTIQYNPKMWAYLVYFGLETVENRLTRIPVIYGTGRRTSFHMPHKPPVAHIPLGVVELASLVANETWIPLIKITRHIDSHDWLRTLSTWISLYPGFGSYSANMHTYYSVHTYEDLCNHCSTIRKRQYAP